MVNLGLAEKGETVPLFIAGKMIETIAIGLLATLFSTILAYPDQFSGGAQYHVARAGRVRRSIT